MSSLFQDLHFVKISKARKCSHCSYYMNKGDSVVTWVEPTIDNKPKRITIHTKCWENGEVSRV